MRALRSPDSDGALARVSAHAETATGARENNEDAFFCDPRFPVYAVSDGMGGHEGGEVASAAAIECVAGAASKIAGAESPAILDATLRKVADAAHGFILKKGGGSGMGATLTALAVAEFGGRLRAVTAHVGDSKCYLIRRGVGEQLTRDHKGDSGGLTNCLGVTRAAHATTDVSSTQLERGDVLVLCSDGLSDYVDAAEAARLVGLEPKRGGAVAISKTLVKAALDGGGHDNVTVVAVVVS